MPQAKAKAPAKRPAPLTPPPKRMPKAKAGRRVNLDERLASARAARAESQGDAPVLTVGGKEFTLPVEMPYDFLRLCQYAEFHAAAAAIGGQDLADAIEDLKLSVDDLETFFDTVAEDLYGVTEGK